MYVFRCLVYYSCHTGTSYWLEVGAMSSQSDGQQLPDEKRTYHLIQTTKEKVASICKLLYLQNTKVIDWYSFMKVSFSSQASYFILRFSSDDGWYENL